MSYCLPVFLDLQPYRHHSHLPSPYRLPSFVPMGTSGSYYGRLQLADFRNLLVCVRFRYLQLSRHLAGEPPGGKCFAVIASVPPLSEAQFVQAPSSYHRFTGSIFLYYITTSHSRIRKLQLESWLYLSKSHQ